jgi:hypothetical protein
MPRSLTTTTGGRRRTASQKPADKAVPQPPETIPIQPAIENLRLRLDYVRDVLGLRIELVSLLANLSHKALRLYRSDKWNPSLSTLVQVDQTLQKHIAAWVKDKNDAQCVSIPLQGPLAKGD